MPARGAPSRRALRGSIRSAWTGASGMPRATAFYWKCLHAAGTCPRPTGWERKIAQRAEERHTYRVEMGRRGVNGDHEDRCGFESRRRHSSLSLMGHDGCESSAALGIRAGEDPAIYGGVVQAASNDPGEGEARAHIREKQVRGLPPPIGTGWTMGDGP